MAFSPDNSKLAITGIMEYFNLVHLDSKGAEDEKKGDAITQQTMARIEKLYFYNDDVLVLIDPDDMATAWAASILTIKETVEKHQEQ
jgi:hypothetical protein